MKSFFSFFFFFLLLSSFSLASSSSSSSSSTTTPLSSSCALPKNLTSCALLTSCADCASFSRPSAKHNPGNLSCLWCASRALCMDSPQVSSLLSSGNLSFCPSGFCHGEKGCAPFCECSTWLPCSPHWGGQVILMAFYGFILSFGAKMIGDGSELLLEIMDPGIIGGLVLPVLGAVPDAMMVLASGVAGSRCDAEMQLQIGMGTLAGSTIMLNTLIWGISVFLGRCDIVHGETRDRTCTMPLSSLRAWRQSGVTVDHDTLWNARIMVTVTLSYFIVQGVAFAYLSDPDGTTAQSVEGWCALAAFVVCVVLLALYCTYQLLNPKLQEKKIALARESYQKQLAVQRWMASAPSAFRATPNAMSHLLSDPNQHHNHLHQGVINAPVSPPPVVDIRGVGLRWKTNAAKQAEEKKALLLEQSERQDGENSERENDDDDDDDDEEESETKGMTTGQIAVKAAVQLAIGTAIVTLFSDPMVEVIDNFGTTTGIPAFLLSFILTPLCSNASEIISSFMMAMKKKRKTISLTFSQVYGAATMNATFVAAVFYALVTFRKLPWTYSAETLSIVLVSWLVGIPGSFFHTIPLWMTIHVILLYPLSLAFVYILEQFAGWT